MYELISIKDITNKWIEHVGLTNEPIYEVEMYTYYGFKKEKVIEIWRESEYEENIKRFIVQFNIE